MAVCGWQCISWQFETQLYEARSPKQKNKWYWPLTPETVEAAIVRERAVDGLDGRASVHDLAATISRAAFANLWSDCESVIDMTTLRTAKSLVLATLLAGLIALGVVVLHLFLIPVAWAFIIAYVTWPAYRWLRTALRGRRSISALVMTSFLTLAFVVPMFSLMVQLTHETAAFLRGAVGYLADNRQQLVELVARVPLAGRWLGPFVDKVTGEPSALAGQFAQWSDRGAAQIAQIAGGIGRNAAKFGFAVFSLFFVYRDGEHLLIQVRRAARPFLGARTDVYLRAMGSVSRSVVYGIVLTAIAQSALAGIGYWAAGAGAPMFLAILTLIVALFPFGTPLVWVPVVIALLLQGHTWPAVGLFVWCALVVSWIDNVIRPFIISSAVRMPFVLVMFGLIGGIAAFGMIGVFIGPFVVAMLLAIWREWQTEQRAREEKTQRGMPAPEPALPAELPSSSSNSPDKRS